MVFTELEETPLIKVGVEFHLYRWHECTCVHESTAGVPQSAMAWAVCGSGHLQHSWADSSMLQQLLKMADLVVRYPNTL